MNDEATRAVFTACDAVGDVAKEHALCADDVLVQTIVGRLRYINHGMGTGTSGVGNPVDFGVDYGSHRLECSKSIISARGECESVAIAVGANEGSRTRVVGANLVSDTADASTTDADDAANHLRRAALGNCTLESLVVARHVGKLVGSSVACEIVILIVLISMHQIF